jgi:phage baseplate assembly protein V
MDSELLRFIRRHFEHQARKLRNLVARGVVSLVNDGLKMQECQIKLLAGELIDKAERPQNSGFTSHPHPEAECFVVFADGERGHPLALVVDDRRYRVKGLKQGEVCIYTDEGDTVTFKRGNRMEVKTKHAVVEAEDDCAVTTKDYSVDCKTWAVNCESWAVTAKTAEFKAEATVEVLTQDYTLQAGVKAAVSSPALALLSPALILSGPGGAPAPVKVGGPLDVQEGISIGGSLSLKEHTHTGVQPGSGQSGPPAGS